MESQLRSACNVQRLVKKTAVQNRESYMADLAEHFAVKQETTMIIEIEKIKSSECNPSTAAKHK